MAQLVRARARAQMFTALGFARWCTIRAAWEKNGAIHPPVLPLLFYTKTMAGSDKYPIHDIYDPKALVADKMPTAFSDRCDQECGSDINLVLVCLSCTVH